MEEGSVVVEGRVEPDHSPLVAVTFQRDAHRKEKYLEAEPKALGISQITMSVLNILCVGVFLSKGLGLLSTDLIIFISSLLVVIAGSLAVAAQSLHLPTLRACLGMQIIACGASICNLVCTLVKMEDIYCWQHGDFNATLYEDLCHRAEVSPNI
uniref:Uncharacterized protein n=1 Tax=Gouania willdenowi TaxID=441366 RepID=A0A8C5DEY4_GOUWI